MKKIICYIDGYNFFHATKDNPSANINFNTLAHSLILDNQVLIDTFYFSAYATWRKKDFQKHKKYVNRLSDTGVTAILSHFKKKQVICSTCGTKYWSHEEKESDVRLALQIVEDAIDEKYDTAFILSGDSDIVPAIHKVKTRFPNKRILIALPKHSLKYARDITTSAHGFVNLSPSRLAKHRFL